MIEVHCEHCNNVFMEDEEVFALNNTNRSGHSPLVCDACARKLAARVSFVERKVGDYKGRLGFLGRLIVGWNAQSEFEKLWASGERLKARPDTPPHYNCRCTMQPIYQWKPEQDSRTRQTHKAKADDRYVPMPEVKPPKVDTPSDVGALAALVKEGFDAAAADGRDVTVELTYSRVGDVVDARSKIEVIGVRELPRESSDQRADMDPSGGFDGRAVDPDVLGQPMSMGGVADILMEEANRVFGPGGLNTVLDEVGDLPDLSKSVVARFDTGTTEKAGVNVIGGDGTITQDGRSVIDGRQSYVDNMIKDWSRREVSELQDFYRTIQELQEKQEHQQKTELAYFWIILQHVLTVKCKTEDIRTAYGSDQIYRAVRELMEKRNGNP